MSAFAVVIPARFASARLPGKPLRDIDGKPMVQHVYERAKESAAEKVIVATDDQRVADAAESFGAAVCMTSADHQSGTERLAEVSRVLEWHDEQVVVNLQGDEPLMPAKLIDQCAAMLQDPHVEMATLASPLRDKDDFEDPHIVKVVIDQAENALYFSRAPIPYSRQASTDQLAIETAQHHHGIYAYRVATLQRLVAAPPAALEQCEQLEQLRALALGIQIKVARPQERPGPGVDTEEDLSAVKRLLARLSGRGS